MKDYIKPIIDIEELHIDDIVLTSIITDENINEVADSFQKDCFIISWQISSNNDDLSIYERFLHVINMFDEKKRTYLKELKIEKNIG